VQSAKDRSIVVADDAVTAVKERPGLTAGLATATALFFARKPLFAAVGRMFRSSDKGSQINRKTTGSRSRADRMEELNG
jgi:hypothetical protein